MAAKSANNVTEKRSSTMVSWGKSIRRFEKEFTLLFGLLAIVVSVVFGIQTSRISAKQTTLEEEQASIADQQRILAERMAQQGSSNNLMGVLDLVSRASSELGGWATATPTGASGPVKMSSDEAIQGYFRQKTSRAEDATIIVPYSGIPNTLANISEFQLRLVPINSLNAISRVLANDPSFQDLKIKGDQQIDLTLGYLLPTLTPKVQSDDPAVAASALIVTSLLVGEGENRKPESLNGVCKAGNFVKVRFNWPKLNLSGIDFESAQFSMANITSADFSGCNLAGASFHNAVLQDVKFRGTLAMIGEPNELTSALENSTLTELHYSDMSASRPNVRVASFVGATFANVEFAALKGNRANFSGCLFDSARFQTTRLSGTDFVRAQFSGATTDARQSIVDCDFTLSDFSSAEMESVLSEKTIFDDAKFTRTLLSNSEFSLSSFRSAEFSGTKLGGCRFNNCVFDDARLLPNLGDDAVACELASANFLKGSAQRAVFQVTATQQVRFDATKLAGADFGRMGATDFANVVFSNGVEADWMRIPFSDDLLAKIEAKDSEALHVRNGPMKLGSDSLILLVSIEGAGYRYRGTLDYKPGVNHFNYQPAKDAGKTVVEYLKKAKTSSSAVHAGLRGDELEHVISGDAELPAVERAATTGRSDEWIKEQVACWKNAVEKATDEQLKKYINLKWNIDFNLPESQPEAAPTN